MSPVLEVAVPVFAIILSGYLAGVFRVLGEASTDALNRFVYYFALPALLFGSTARVPTEEIFNWPFLSAYLGGLAGTFAVTTLIGGMLFGGSVAVQALRGASTIFANTGYMGIPLAITAYGADGALPAVVLTASVTLVVIGSSVAAIELERQRGNGVLSLLAGVGGALVRNPILVAPFLGVGVSLTGLALPSPAVTYLEIMGAASVPCALFALGLFLVGRPLAAGAGEVGLLAGIKLIVHPAITWWMAMHVFAMEPLWATVAVLLAALPTGANVFVLAQHYGIFVQRASAVTMVSTALSVLTVPIVLILLGSP